MSCTVGFPYLLPVKGQLTSSILSLALQNRLASSLLLQSSGAGVGLMKAWSSPPFPSHPNQGQLLPTVMTNYKKRADREGLIPQPIPTLFPVHSPQVQGSHEDPQVQHVQGALQPPLGLSSLGVHRDLVPPEKEQGGREEAERIRGSLSPDPPAKNHQGVGEIGATVVVTGPSPFCWPNC